MSRRLTAPSTAPASRPVMSPTTITAGVDHVESGSVAPAKITTIAGVHAIALIDTHRQGCRTFPLSTRAWAAPINAPIVAPKAADAARTTITDGGGPDASPSAAGADASDQPIPATATVATIHQPRDRPG